MSSLFYPKMAVINIRKNVAMYLPYMMTCICAIMMFFILLSIAFNPGLGNMPGSASLVMMLGFGVVIIGIFSLVFLFYTNSFLMKKRKKELGLYSILGLEKKHIGYILFFENLFTSAGSLVMGILGGIVFGKLLYLVLLKLIQTDIPFVFELNMIPFVATFLLFGGIFALTLLFNLLAIGKNRPIELLQGEKHGEKEPKAKWLLALLGVMLLGIGYYIAITVESPLLALVQFFLAVLLVMAGTYLLFIAGSIAVLKILKKNTKFYYQPNHFVSVSGMLYRMKQNAVGLANIAILSTGVLLCIATTVCLSIGMEDLLKSMYPQDGKIRLTTEREEDRQALEGLMRKYADESRIELQNYTQFNVAVYNVEQREREMIIHTENTESMDVASMYNQFMDLNDFNRVDGSQYSLAKDEILVQGTNGTYPYDTVKIGDREFKVKEQVRESLVTNYNEARLLNGYLIVFADPEVMEEAIRPIIGGEKIEITTYIGFDMDVELKDQQVLKDKVAENLWDTMQDVEFRTPLFLRAEIGQEYRAMISGFLFIGVFLGVLFMVATTLIIYYKQISEGYDDKARFEIMQKVGMSKQEIKKSISSQILMVFFLPVLVAILHVGAAFPMMSKLLQIFGLFNNTLFLICMLVTVAVFAVVYCLVYAATAKTYYKIAG